MKIEDKVTSLLLSKRMKELGWDYETERYWIISRFDETRKEIRLINDPTKDYRYDNMEVYPAPDTTEIGKSLPIYLYLTGIEFTLHTAKYKDEWEIWYQHFGKRAKQIDIMNFYGDTEAEARGKMWCYLKERKLI